MKPKTCSGARPTSIAADTGRRCVRFLPAEILRGSARLEPKPAAARLHQGRKRVTVVLRIAARGGAEALVTCGAVAELQQAKAELQPHIGVIGPAHQALPEISGRRRVVADCLVRLGQAEQGFGRARGIIQSASEGRFGLGVMFTPEQYVAELDRKLRQQRRDVETAIERL